MLDGPASCRLQQYNCHMEATALRAVPLLSRVSAAIIHTMHEPYPNPLPPPSLPSCQFPMLHCPQASRVVATSPGPTCALSTCPPLTLMVCGPSKETHKQPSFVPCRNPLLSISLAALPAGESGGNHKPRSTRGVNPMTAISDGLIR